MDGVGSLRTLATQGAVSSVQANSSLNTACGDQVDDEGDAVLHSITNFPVFKGAQAVTAVSRHTIRT
jgi:hypothetical protein